MRTTSTYHRNMRIHMTVLSFGVLALGIFSVVHANSSSSGFLNEPKIVIVIACIAYGLYALVTTLLTWLLAKKRFGVFIAHAIGVAALFGVFSFA